MKAICEFQPGADLVHWGWKTILARAWYTPYRGPLLVGSAHTYDPVSRLQVKQIEESAQIKLWAPSLAFPEEYDPLLSHGLAVCQLIDCRPMREEDRRAACFLSSWSIADKWAWELAHVQAIEPVALARPCVGATDSEWSIEKLRPCQTDMFVETPQIPTTTRPSPGPIPPRSIEAIELKEQLVLL